MAPSFPASKLGWLSSIAAWVGTMKLALMRVRSTIATKSPGSRPVWNAAVAPASMAGWNMMLSAATWKSGVTIPTTSRSSIASSTITVCAVTSRARWLHSTPLGRPVVPPV